MGGIDQRQRVFSHFDSTHIITHSKLGYAKRINVRFFAISHLCQISHLSELIVGQNGLLAALGRRLNQLPDLSFYLAMIVCLHFHLFPSR